MASSPAKQTPSSTKQKKFTALRVCEVCNKEVKAGYKCPICKTEFQSRVKDGKTNMAREKHKIKEAMRKLHDNHEYDMLTVYFKPVAKFSRIYFELVPTDGDMQSIIFDTKKDLTYMGKELKEFFINFYCEMIAKKKDTIFDKNKDGNTEEPQADQPLKQQANADVDQIKFIDELNRFNKPRLSTRKNFSVLSMSSGKTTDRSKQKRPNSNEIDDTAATKYQKQQERPDIESHVVSSKITSDNNTNFQHFEETERLHLPYNHDRQKIDNKDISKFQPIEETERLHVLLAQDRQPNNINITSNFRPIEETEPLQLPFAKERSQNNKTVVSHPFNNVNEPLLEPITVDTQQENSSEMMQHSRSSPVLAYYGKNKLANYANDISTQNRSPNNQQFSPYFDSPFSSHIEQRNYIEMMKRNNLSQFQNLNDQQTRIYQPANYDLVTGQRSQSSSGFNELYASGEQQVNFRTTSFPTHHPHYRNSQFTIAASIASTKQSKKNTEIQVTHPTGGNDVTLMEQQNVTVDEDKRNSYKETQQSRDFLLHYYGK